VLPNFCASGSMGLYDPRVCTLLSTACFWFRARITPDGCGSADPGSKQNRNPPIALTIRPNSICPLHEVRAGSQSSGSPMTTPPNPSTLTGLTYFNSLVCCHGITHTIRVPTLRHPPKKTSKPRFNVQRRPFCSLVSPTVPHCTLVAFIMR